VLVISNIRENGQPIGLGDAGHFWHSDLSYKDGAEPRLDAACAGAAGHRRRHLFANQHTAWERLPEDLKRAVEACRPSTATWRATKTCAS
jgi:taurine dioxygenase